ncbi:MAG TPA: MarP family serine protease [Kineosporiaceae bacterium]
MIDIVLGLVIIGYAISGFRQGFAVGMLSLGGFVLGAVVAMEVVPPLADGLDQGLQRSFVMLAAVLLFAWLGQLGGALVGGRLRDRLTLPAAQVVDQLTGAVAGVIAVALVLWFVGGALRGSPSPALARVVAQSRLLAAIDSVVPQPVATVAQSFRDAVAGSSFPRVFAGVAPEQIVPVPRPDPGAMSRNVLFAAQRSIVKVTGDAEACNRSVEGSGAVIGPQRVVTNAHVVAGMKRPTVQVGGVGTRYPARVVVFDPSRDIAVLSVPRLTAPALEWGSNLPQGSDAVVAGFPRNGAFTSGAARVRSVLNATGQDIYGRPGAVRKVYQLYAKVEPGNSGGPLLATDGTLAGIVFAKSLDDPSTGYALTFDEAQPDLTTGVHSTVPVSTGACAAG